MGMASLQSPLRILEEIAELFASDPRPQEILAFRLSDATVQRASELLELNRNGQLDHELVHELDQFEQAELLLRLVKARIRAQMDQTTR
jgi:hypothetical protein